MTRTARWAATIVMAAGVALPGCAGGKPEAQPTTQPRDAWVFAERHPALAVNPSTLIMSGAPPLVCFFPGGQLRIVDTFTRQPIVAATVKPNDLVSVSPEGGVIVGGNKLLPGPLPLGHEYEIWLGSASNPRPSP